MTCSTLGELDRLAGVSPAVGDLVVVDPRPTPEPGDLVLRSSTSGRVLLRGVIIAVHRDR
jgi:hypothetical protein